MEPFEAYKLYNAIKLHFTSKSYDYFKYMGKVKWLDTVAQKQKFLSNKQKYFYAQLGRHEDPEGLVISNLLINPKTFITDIISDESNKVWQEWQKRNQSITYTFNKEIQDVYKDIYKMNSNGVPTILEYYISSAISAETIIILDSFGDLLNQWLQIDHPIVGKYVSNLIKYRPFVKFDKNKCKEILKSLISDK